MRSPCGRMTAVSVALVLTRLAGAAETNSADVWIGTVAVISNTLAVAGGSASGSGSFAHGYSSATGAYSVAMGFGALAHHDRAFIWSDGAAGTALVTTAEGQFRIHAAGGIHLLGGSIVGDGSGLVNLAGSNLVSGSVSSTQLGAGSVLDSHLAVGAVGTNAAAIPQWNGWGDGRFLNAAGADTMMGALTVSNSITALRASIRGLIQQDLPNENMGIQASDCPVPDTQTNSVWMGRDVLRASTNGQLNVAIGHFAMHRAQGSANSGLGARALCLAIGSYNQGVGYTAGYGATGSYNSAFGWMSGVYAHGNGNSAYGHSSHEGARGSYNSALGYGAGRFAAGDNNSAVGIWAGYAATGSQNTAVGCYALCGSPSTNNVAIGSWASGYGPGGSMNVACGTLAGYKVTNGVNNVFLGGAAGRYDMGTRTVTNSVALGAFAQVSASDTVVLGNTNQTIVVGGSCPTNARVVIKPRGELTVLGPAILAWVPPQGDLSMGSFTNGLPR